MNKINPQKLNPNITYFAKVDWRNDNRLFGIRQADRAFHTYILGKTGAGKTNLLLTKIRQDLEHGRGLCVFDIHGDIINAVLKYIPQHRQQDIIHLDVANPNLTIGYNPIKRVSYEKRSLVASGILDTFQKMWRGAWGVRMEHILRYILLTLLDQPKATFSDITRIIYDTNYQQTCLRNVINDDVKRFWTHEYAKYTRNDLSPILNKIGAFLAHPTIKRILVDNQHDLSIRRVMDTKKILLVNLDKGTLGTDVVHLLGSLLLSSITSASLNRSEILEHLRQPFYVYLDEFQSYTSPTLINLLSEIRKFKVALVLAHQYSHQLSDDIKQAILGNVGTIITFRLGIQDAQHFAKEFVKHHPPIEVIDFVNRENYHIYLKLMIDGKPSEPFSAITVHHSALFG